MHIIFRYTIRKILRTLLFCKIQKCRRKMIKMENTYPLEIQNIFQKTFKNLLKQFSVHLYAVEFRSNKYVLFLQWIF